MNEAAPVSRRDLADDAAYPLTKSAKRIADLRERAGDNCHLCGFPIWFAAPHTRNVAGKNVHFHYKSPVAPSLDHVVPRSAARGLHDNVKLSHKWCNHRRGNDSPSEFWNKAGSEHKGVVLKELRRLGLL